MKCIFFFAKRVESTKSNPNCHNGKFPIKVAMHAN